MKRSISATLLFLISFVSPLPAQNLQPGYDRQELAEIMCVSARTGGGDKYVSDSNYIAAPTAYTLAYRSPEVGLLNLWELWTSDNKMAVISIRGTVQQADSWLANFYSAMLPAYGELYLSNNDTFRYDLASDPKAAVHAGWLIGTGFLSKDILAHIDSCYKNGFRNFTITGHSQGGAISYLLTAYLLRMQKNNALPADIRFKTYCTAAPKPGNLFFAYEYEEMTNGGWAFNVVNTDDWVPEVPMSIQTIHDFNNVNPFKSAKSMIRKLPFPKDLVLRYVFNRLDKPSRKAQRNAEKYLGKKMVKEIRRKLKGLSVPGYYPSAHYVRTGPYILLRPTEEYYKRFPVDEKKIFMHHLHHPYLFLLDKSLLEKKK
jgi:hypothetical protein